MSEKIRFAVLGYGYMGKRHAEMINRNPEAELVALIDPQKKAFDYPVSYFSSLEEFFRSNLDVDVITIASPNGLHGQALAALDHRKHVLVEKPLALSTIDAEKIGAKSLRIGRKVFTVAQNRYARWSVWLKNMAESGGLGKVYLVQVNCFWNRDERYYAGSNWRGSRTLDGGPLFTQFFHFIDLMYWILGDIENIQARFANFNHRQTTEFEDSGLLNFDFIKGGMGGINYTTSAYEQNQESSISIIAENGSIKISGQYLDKIEYCHIKDYQFTSEELVEGKPEENYFKVIANVIDVLKGRAEMTSTVMEGIKIIDIISRIYALKQDPMKSLS